LVDEEVAAVRRSPKVGAVGKLSDGPAAVCLQAMCESGMRTEVVGPGLARRTAGAWVLIGLGVIEVHPPAGRGGVREHVGRTAQEHCLAHGIGNLVAVCRGQPGEVENRLYGDVAAAEPLPDLPGDDRPTPSTLVTPAADRSTSSVRWT
jgi:hypothetical protein